MGAGGDVLDLASILRGFDADAQAADFIRLDQSLGDTRIEVNADGSGSDFTAVADLQGVSGIDLGQLIAAGNLELA
jgi:hypothetical protein